MIRRILRKVKSVLKGFFQKSHRQVFSEIYKKGVWGKSNEIYYSGTGSDDENSFPYIDVVTKFINEKKISSVVDLGCGDFRIGRKITEQCNVQYTGVDVVPDLIEYNRKKYSSLNIRFEAINIVTGRLPDGNLCLIRQVLQHLSNSDIQKILAKCSKYDYLIITEHQPTATDIIRNKDKQFNENIRLIENSGVYLDYPPFNLKVVDLLTVYPKAEENSKIVTFLVSR